MSYPFQIVDVFAEKQLAGNQLAIVRNAAGLTTQQMQDIALETNYSETTFVVEESQGHAKVRIFTPGHELPFAGHPTLGTAWALTAGQGEITLQLGVGPVTVKFIDGIAWMIPPPVSFLGECPRIQAARLLGLDEHDILNETPVELAEVGPQFLLIPLKDLDALRRARLQTEHHARLRKDGFNGVFLFTSDSYGDDADFASRMFFDAAGVREDPATGSANAAFAAYLKKYKGDIGDVVVDQGVEINRPSRIYLKVAETLQVGGRVFSVVSGTLDI